MINYLRANQFIYRETQDLTLPSRCSSKLLRYFMIYEAYLLLKLNIIALIIIRFFCCLFLQQQGIFTKKSSPTRSWFESLEVNLVLLFHIHSKTSPWDPSYQEQLKHLVQRILHKIHQFYKPLNFKLQSKLPDALTSKTILFIAT